MSIKLLSLPKITDRRGNLSFFEDGVPVPFNISEVRWTYDIPGDTSKNIKRYINTDEIIIALSGSYDVSTKSDTDEQTTHLNRAYNGLLLPKGTQKTLDNFSTNSVALTISASNDTNVSKKAKQDIVTNEMYNVYDCHLIEIDKQNAENKGRYSTVKNNVEIPFDIKRIYYLYDVPFGVMRGGHAHKTLNQVLFAVSGSFTVNINDGKVKRSITLNRPNQGLLIKPGIWRTIDNFSSGSVCLVLASEKYNPDDYIRKYNEFIDYRRNPI